MLTCTMAARSPSQRISDGLVARITCVADSHVNTPKSKNNPKPMNP